jgi:hypothetical protein
LAGLLAVAGFAGLGAAPGRADEPAAADFKGSGVCRFLTEDYQLPTKAEASINKVVTDALRKHEEVFGFKAPTNFAVRIRIFGRFGDFENFTRTNRYAQQLLQNSQSISNLGGYYSHRIRQIITWPQRHQTDLANTLLHEASHAILHSAYRRVPIWLSEGSATYFAYPRQLQDKRDVGTLQYRWAKLLVMLRAKQLPPARTLLNMTEEEWSKIDPTVTYSTAWSLFQLMMSTPPRQEVLRQYLKDLQKRRGRGAAEEDPAAIYEKIGPGGVAQLEKDWHDWITKGSARVLGPRMEELLEQVR